MSGRRILLVEDDDAVRNVARTSLEMVDGWQVATASSGPDWLARAGADRPDAILLDLSTPGVDARGAVRGLRAQPGTRTIPVIVLTATGHSTEVPLLLTLDVAAVVPKPFDPLRLVSDVGRILGWPR